MNKKFVGIDIGSRTTKLVVVDAVLAQMIEDFAVDGVIDLTWQACHKTRSDLAKSK